MRLLISVLIWVSLAGLSWATDYHVSTSGNDSTGDGSSSTPWRTPEYGAKQLSAGDTLLIHIGTYTLLASNLPAGQQTMDRYRAFVSPPYNIDGSSGNEFTIKAYGDGTVLLDAGTSPEYPAVGSNYGNYVIVDGVSVRGAAILMGSSYSTIKNCDLYGGIDCPESNGGDNFGVVVRVENGTDCLIQNNKLHDNQLGITRDNSPLLTEYDSTNLIIENNDVYNSVAAGILLKDNPENVTVRYNYIYNNNDTGLILGIQDLGHNVYIYQNVFRNNDTTGAGSWGGQIHLHYYVDTIEIYNNTIVNGQYLGDITHSGGGSPTGATNISVWNNIFYNPNVRHYDIGTGGTNARLANDWDYSDYNCFYNDVGWKDGSNTYSTLTDWDDLGVDTNSITTDPGFINSSGTDAADYKRSSYTTNGRGGAYESVMGAYITGNETIGYSDDVESTNGTITSGTTWQTGIQIQ